MSRQSGFTFLEVAVTVVVIMIAVAVAAPRVATALNGSRLNSAASGVAALMSSARSESVSSGRICEAECAAESGTCSVACFERKVGTETVAANKQIVKTYELPFGELAAADGTVADRSTAILFYPDGTSSGGSVIVTGDGGEKIIVEVFRATALPYVYEAAGK